MGKDAVTRLAAIISDQLTLVTCSNVISGTVSDAEGNPNRCQTGKDVEEWTRRF